MQDREVSIKKRCPECNSLMFELRYKHNGINKIDYRCPHPHGMSGRKDLIVEHVTTGDFEDECTVL